MTSVPLSLLERFTANLSKRQVSGVLPGRRLAGKRGGWQFGRLRETPSARFAIATKSKLKLEVPYLGI